MRILRALPSPRRDSPRGSSPATALRPSGYPPRLDIGCRDGRASDVRVKRHERTTDRLLVHDGKRLDGKHLFVSQRDPSARRCQFKRRVVSVAAFPPFNPSAGNEPCAPRGNRLLQKFRPSRPGASTYSCLILGRPELVLTSALDEFEGRVALERVELLGQE